jgi:GntR family transcriptional repressor for pyruvate dehydrogenase complex
MDQSLIGGYTMSDLFEARIAIEGQTAELAARRLTDHHRELLQSIIGAASDPDITHLDFVKLDYRFHRQIADASGNPLLLHMWDSLGTQFEEYSMRVIEMPGRLERAHADHCGITDAILAGDAKGAGGRAREHVLTVQRELQGNGQHAVQRRELS